MKKTRLGMLIVFIMSIIIILSACGEKGSQGLEYKSNGDKTCAVVGIGSCEDENLVIPGKSPDGDTVTSIADNAFEGTKIRTLSMADTVTEMGSYAFFRCTRLEDVKFSKNLKKIGENAFDTCEALTEISLPDSLEILGTEKTIGSETTVSGSVFALCKNLSKVNIPKNLKVLNKYVFGEGALTEVKMDTDFKYGDFGISLYEDGIESNIFSMYQTKPEDTNDRIIELGDDLKKLSYAQIFNSETVKINGEELVLPEPKCTPGFYGAEDDTTAYNVREDGKIEELTYNTRSGKYEVRTNYSDDKECVYDFEFNEDLKGYLYTDKYGDNYFVVYDNYLFLNGQIYTLDIQYKD